LFHFKDQTFVSLRSNLCLTAKTVLYSPGQGLANIFDPRSPVAIGKPDRKVCKASHCGSKQKQRSFAAITPSLIVRATYARVLFFAHILFLANRTFNATLNERKQHHFSVSHAAEIC